MNFNKQINRNNTDCLKYDSRTENNIPADAMPMWVADMDFKCPYEILDVLEKKNDFGIYGYPKISDGYYNAVKKWYDTNFGVTLQKEWIIPTPGTIFAIATAIKTLTNEEDYVMVNTPIYPMFVKAVAENKRRILSSNLVYQNNRYIMNFEDIELKIQQYGVKVFLLCSPHNPTGRVWSAQELAQLVEICRRNNVILLSDEVHSDFVWDATHTCMLKFEDFKDNIIVFSSPTKTFNLSGLKISNVFIPNDQIREMYEVELSRTGYGTPNSVGLVACQAAYDKGQKWANELKKYIKENIDLVEKFFAKKLPKIKVVHPEGTYLLWIDFRELNIPESSLDDLLLNYAKIWLSDGNSFGEGGKGFKRMNVALPRAKLKVALKNLEKTFRKG